MKKLWSLLLALSLILVMAACSDKDETSKEQDNNKDKEDEQAEEVTITYANWNLGTEEENNIERRMIAAFQDQFPNIKVELDESITGDWNAALAAAASAGKMPDVFMMASLPLGLQNDWLMDITSIVEGDEEYNSIPGIVKESVTFEEKVVAVPFAQHMLGYFVNKDLFNAANLDYPEFGSSVEDFTAAIKGITNLSDGKVGIQDINNVPDWYPGAVNPDLGWYTYTDGKYSLNSKEFIGAINYANELESNNYTFNSLTEEQKASFSSQDGNEVWLAGGIGIKWDGTWALAGLAENTTFEYDFIGLPGNRTAITNDLLGVSASAENPEEAYLFAKWMSYGKEGFMKRMEIADEMGIPVATLPINTDQEVVDEYFSRLDIPGVRKAFDSIETAILEPFKTVPGYVDSRFTGATGVKVGEVENAPAQDLLGAFMRGELKVEDYAAQLDKLANDKYNEVLQSMQN